MIRVAAIQFSVGMSRTLAEHIDRVTSLADDAVARGASLVVFPEYLCADLLLPARLDPGTPDPRSTDGLFTRLDSYFLEFATAMSALAIRHRVWLIAGTYAHTDSDGLIRNSAQVFGPLGEHLEQPKQHVAYELIHNRSSVVPGTRQLVIEMAGVEVAVLVCYDAQYPETARAILGHPDVDLLVIPGCALEEWGRHRLRAAAAARAMETFAFAINAQLAGNLQIEGLIDYTFWAQSSILSPICRPFPVDGVLADGEAGGESVLIADLDVKLLRASRPKAIPSPAGRFTQVNVARSSAGQGSTER